MPALETLLAVDPMLVVTAVAAVLVGIFVLFLVLERSFENAAQRTTQEATGAAMGAGSIGLVVLVEGIHIIAEAPGLVMGLLGIGAILSGISWEVAGAIFAVTYVVLAAVRGDQ